LIDKKNYLGTISRLNVTSGKKYLRADDNDEPMSSPILVTGMFRSAKPISSIPSRVKHPQ